MTFPLIGSSPVVNDPTLYAPKATDEQGNLNPELLAPPVCPTEFQATDLFTSEHQQLISYELSEQACFPDVQPASLSGIEGQTQSEPTESLDQRMTRWQGQLNRYENFPASQLGALGTEVDEMLSDPALRQQLLERYGLNTPENREYLIAAAVAEAGGTPDSQHAGIDTGPVMAAIINRTLVQNMMKELAMNGDFKPANRLSFRDIVEQEGQFAETPGRASVLLRGGQTEGHHERLFAEGTSARVDFDRLADQALAGQTRFEGLDYNFSDIYYFHGDHNEYPRSQIGFSTDSHIYARMSVNDRTKPHYVYEGLRLRGAVQTNE